MSVVSRLISTRYDFVASSDRTLLTPFYQDLRTNVGSRRGHPLGTYTEAVYTAASPVLDGQPLLKAQEMGGFCLGSTVVLVFEAPKNFQFTVTAGQKVKVGQALGDVAPALAESKKDQ